MATIIELPRSTATRARSALHSAGTIAGAIFFPLYAAVHGVGFAAQWHDMSVANPHSGTPLLNGALHLGAAGSALVGLLWLAAIAGFLTLGLRVAWQQRLERGPLVAVTALSLALCVLNCPQAIAGVLLDAAILGALALIPVLPSGRRNVDARMIAFPAGSDRLVRTARPARYAVRPITHS
jgi:hypothetical protein